MTRALASPPPPSFYSARSPPPPSPTLPSTLFSTPPTPPAPSSLSSTFRFPSSPPVPPLPLPGSLAPFPTSSLEEFAFPTSNGSNSPATGHSPLGPPTVSPILPSPSSVGSSYESPNLIDSSSSNPNHSLSSTSSSSASTTTSISSTGRRNSRVGRGPLGSYMKNGRAQPQPQQDSPSPASFNGHTPMRSRADSSSSSSGMASRSGSGDANPETSMTMIGSGSMGSSTGSSASSKSKLGSLRALAVVEENLGSSGPSAFGHGRGAPGALSFSGRSISQGTSDTSGSGTIAANGMMGFRDREKDRFQGGDSRGGGTSEFGVLPTGGRSPNGLLSSSPSYSYVVQHGQQPPQLRRGESATAAAAAARNRFFMVDDMNRPLASNGGNAIARALLAANGDTGEGEQLYHSPSSSLSSTTSHSGPSASTGSASPPSDFVSPPSSGNGSGDQLGDATNGREMEPGGTRNSAGRDSTFKFPNPELINGMVSNTSSIYSSGGWSSNTPTPTSTVRKNISTPAPGTATASSGSHGMSLFSVPRGGNRSPSRSRTVRANHGHTPSTGSFASTASTSLDMSQESFDISKVLSSFSHSSPNSSPRNHSPNSPSTPLPPFVDQAFGSNMGGFHNIRFGGSTGKSPNLGSSSEEDDVLAKALRMSTMGMGGEMIMEGGEYDAVDDDESQEVDGVTLPRVMPLAIKRDGSTSGAPLGLVRKPSKTVRNLAQAAEPPTSGRSSMESDPRRSLELSDHMVPPSPRRQWTIDSSPTPSATNATASGVLARALQISQGRSSSFSSSQTAKSQTRMLAAKDREMEAAMIRQQREREREKVLRLQAPPLPRFRSNEEQSPAPSTPSPSLLGNSPSPTMRPSHTKNSSSLEFSISAFSGHTNIGNYPSPDLPAERDRSSPSGDILLEFLKSSAAQGALQGDTVDLSHQKAREFSDETVELLRDRVHDGGTQITRLALGYNQLMTLPPSFAALGSVLRYLNIRCNALRRFPAVVTQLPKLEILDLRGNKITHLPGKPGFLVGLKVLSIAKNRITDLPPYLSQFRMLRVLKLENNPIVWPPKDVWTFTNEPSPGAGDTEAKNKESARMATWVKGLLIWIRDNAAARPITDYDREGGSSSEEFMHKRPKRLSLSRSPRSKGVSLTAPSSPTTGMRPLTLSRVAMPPPPPVAAIPPTPEPGSGDGGFDVPNILVSPRSSSSTLRPAANGGHNMSASTSVAPSKPRPTIKAKKSLPDLRQDHASILEERRATESDKDAETSESREFPRELKLTALRRSSSAFAPKKSPMLRGQGGHSSPPSVVVKFAEQPVPPRTRLNASPRGKRKPSVPEERNDDRPRSDRDSGAYFRRLSMLPASTISKTVPPALLQATDAVRGILFSLSQMYSALKQFVVFATQDRLPAALAKAMSSADNAMGKLIDALDRFDTLSRRGIPEAPVIREVFVACQDNVVVFGKLTGMLSVQLKVLVASADIRYSRTLLLMLHGCASEVAIAWQTINPLSTEVIALIRDPQAQTKVMLQPPTPSPTLPDQPAHRKMSSSAAFRPSLPSPVGSNSAWRRAGSFSVADVQAGAALPPASALPPSPMIPGSNNTAPGTPKASPTPPPPQVSSSLADPSIQRSRPARPVPHATPKEPVYKEIMNIFNNQPPSPATTPTPNPFGKAHSKTSSRESNADSPARSHTTLPLVPSPSQQSQDGRAAPRNANAAKMDEEFFEMVETATATALDVFGLLIDTLSEAHARATAAAMSEDSVPATALPSKNIRDLGILCETGNEASRRLRESCDKIRRPEGEGADQARREAEVSLGGDASEFAKNVVQVATLAKTITLEDQSGFPPRVRSSLRLLTDTTKELAILLRVSSFNPPRNEATPKAHQTPTLASTIPPPQASQSH